MSVSREESQAKLDLMAQGAMFYKSDQEYTTADFFEQQVAKAGQRDFLIDAQGTMSWDQLNRDANRYCALLRERGMQTGQVAALMISNRLAFFSAWLGIAKAGLTVAMINTEVRGQQLQHMINITGARTLLVGEEYLENLDFGDQSIAAEQILVIADSGSAVPLPDGVERIEPLLEKQPQSNPSPQIRRGLTGASPAQYCFTSGTTGLPKAAVISHARWLGVGKSWQLLQGTDETDVFYCVLPLFHGAAGMSLTSNAMHAGGKLILKRRFSVSRFWPEVRRYGVTTFQYIGEICRYLVASPKQSDDRNHSLKRMMGAGMSEDVWWQFLDRFGDVTVFEGMGATESNCSLVNPDGKPGSCGRIPFRDRSNARLVRYDLDNECHVRDSNGHLAEVDSNEVGELIGMILDLPGTVSGHFEGYTDAVATEKKILHNVFQAGDAWFATGDLLKRDDDDYYYFVDRIGDTYRWKSENISTTEVACELSAYNSAEVINAYGVKVPRHEGRAGMAAIELKKGHQFDGRKFYAVAVGALPNYAVPLFVRISSHSELTTTFKLRKVELRRQGYSPELCRDPLFVLNHGLQSYVPYSVSALQQLRIEKFNVDQ